VGLDALLAGVVDRAYSQVVLELLEQGGAILPVNISRMTS
jgi:hypothetical protein